MSTIAYGSGRNMRYSQGGKMEIIRLVEESDLLVTRTLKELDVARSTFYRWYRRYEVEGYEVFLYRPPTSLKLKKNSKFFSCKAEFS